MTLKIQNGRPIPLTLTEALRNVLREMPAGAYCDWPGRRGVIYYAARREGVQVVVRKTETGILRVWRRR
jgi:hypothetical protein